MLQPNLWWQLGIFGWKDIIEILFLSGVFYYISCWLKRDFQKPLLLYFYGYCGLFIVTHYAHLNTISSSLLLFAPVIAIGFIVLHQETLQRNFIMLHNITPSPHQSEHWTESLIRASLVGVSNNKQIRCLIEKKDALTAAIECPVFLESTITQGLLDMLIDSNSFDSDKMVWLKQDGTLKGINCTWKKTSVEEWLAQEVKEQEEWLQDALFFTSKTDALFFLINPTSRTCTLVAQGKVIERVSAHSALKTIKRYLGLLEPLQKGESHAPESQTHTTQQPLR